MMFPALLTATQTDTIATVADTAVGSLVSAIWQGALLAGAAALALRLLPKTPAGVRFAIWFGVFAVVAALPFAGLVHGAGSAGFAESHSAWLTFGGSWGIALLAVWGVGSAVRMGMLAVGAVRVRSLWRRAVPVDLTEASGLISAGRRAQICVSEEVDRPSVIGFFAPKILIPSWLLERLTPEEIAQVVLHEAGHLGRADDWLNLVQKLALAVFPLNPALLWIERRLCFERELACDERVLGATEAPKAYAACLVALAEQRMNRRSAALVMAALGRDSDLSARVARILARGERMRPRQARLVMAGAVLVLTVGAFGLERCPELVQFAPGHQAVLTDMAAASQLPGSLGRRTGTGEFQAQPVVFRPGMARESIMVARRPVAQGRVRAAQISPAVAISGLTRPREIQAVAPAPGIGPIRATDLVQRTARTRRPTEVRGSLQWVVTASWTTADGDRVVMSSYAVEGSPQVRMARVVAQANGWPEAGQDSGTAASNGARPAEVVRYATAVPVRGGWLVLQL